jgi:HEAT repeat protein
MAAKALGHIGTAKAVVSLLRTLRGHLDAGVRCTVAECLATISPPVAAVVGPLIKAWGDESPEVREAATVALINLGEMAVAKLAAALGQQPPEVRRRAAAALEKMAPRSLGAADALVLALEDEDGCVVVHAAAAILKIFAANPVTRTECRQGGRPLAGGPVPANERALNVLIDLVRCKGGPRQDRQHAAETLGRVGSGVTLAYQTLTEVVSDESENRLVRGSARWALERLGQEEGSIRQPR